MDKHLAKAIACHHAGDYQAAETLYQDILLKDPKNINALHLWGLNSS